MEAQRSLLSKDSHIALLLTLIPFPGPLTLNP